MTFSEELREKTAFAEEVLKKYLPEEGGYASRVIEAVNYSALAGGKRLRPVIMREVFLLFGGKGEVIEPFMAALELIHNYSLVHDDLPAMDNDLYRRGKKTTHAVYGAGMATLAGDAMLNLSVETALKAFDKCDGSYDKVVRAIRILFHKAGINGMLGGQSADVDAEERDLTVDMDKLLFIHENKTAALLEAAFMIGGTLAGADKEEIEILKKTGSDMGIAFQIKDDILDVTGDEKKLGKHVGSDAENGKETYVTLCGLDKAAADQKELSLRAIERLDSLGKKNGFLRELVSSLIDREM